MRPARLGRVRWDHPGPGAQINLAPADFRHLGPALRRKQEHFDETTERIPKQVCANVNAAHFIHLEEAVTRPAGLLAHGQKQWLEIGMLLVQDARLLMLDEPVAGMSAEEKDETGRLLHVVTDMIASDAESTRQAIRRARQAAGSRSISNASEDSAAIAASPHVAGYCYTQVTDTEQEVNGLLTYDRKMKFDANATYPKIFFAADRWLEPAEIAQIAPLTKDEKVQKLLAGTYTPAGPDGVEKHSTTAAVDKPQTEPQQATAGNAAAGAAATLAEDFFPPIPSQAKRPIATKSATPASIAMRRVVWMLMVLLAPAILAFVFGWLTFRSRVTGVSRPTSAHAVGATADASQHGVALRESAAGAADARRAAAGARAAPGAGRIARGRAAPAAGGARATRERAGGVPADRQLRTRALHVGTGGRLREVQAVPPRHRAARTRGRHPGAALRCPR